MNNNDILRRLRFAFDLSNPQTAKLFGLDPNSAIELDAKDVPGRMAKDEDEDFVALSDRELAAFLDGLIAHRRGLREDAPTRPALPEDYRLSRNESLKKLRIAMNYRDDDMLAALAAGGSELSKSELSALFRKPGHKHYRVCGNQVLRNFIKGVTLSLRPDTAEKD